MIELIKSGETEPVVDRVTLGEMVHGSHRRGRPEHECRNRYGRFWGRSKQGPLHLEPSIERNWTNGHFAQIQVEPFRFAVSRSQTTVRPLWSRCADCRSGF